MCLWGGGGGHIRVEVWRAAKAGLLLIALIHPQIEIGRAARACVL